jgi:hypothetical protein
LPRRKIPESLPERAALVYSVWMIGGSYPAG